MALSAALMRTTSSLLSPARGERRPGLRHLRCDAPRSETASWRISRVQPLVRLQHLGLVGRLGARGALSPRSLSLLQHPGPPPRLLLLQRRGGSRRRESFLRPGSELAFLRRTLESSLLERAVGPSCDHMSVQLRVVSD